MNNDREYVKAVKLAEDNINDIENRGIKAVGDDVLDFIDNILTPEEVVESNLRASLISEIIKARQDKGISQKMLEELSGVKQPVIARMEKGSTSPQIDTLLKILLPLGKTLAIVPLKK